MPTYVSILRIPQMIWVWRATVEWYWQGKPKNSEKKPVPVPLCPPQFPHWLTRARTRAFAVRGRRLTTWAMARPDQDGLLLFLSCAKRNFVIAAKLLWATRIYFHKKLPAFMERKYSLERSQETEVLTPYGVVGRYQRSGGRHCLHLQDWTYPKGIVLCHTENISSIRIICNL
jgi:hypothetical protein